MNIILKLFRTMRSLISFSPAKEIKLHKLEELANFLQTVPDEKFDPNYWYTSDDPDKTIHSCGTAACALGWATVLWPNDLSIQKYDLDCGPAFHGIVIYRDEQNKAYSGLSGLSAAIHFFNIDTSESYYIFNDKNINKEQIISRLREVGKKYA